MKSIKLDNILVLLGKAPRKPEPAEFNPQAKEIHYSKWVKDRETFLKRRKEARAAEVHIHSHKWRKRRWAFLIFTNLLFVMSYYFDVQLLEGSLTGSRFFGFHLIDLNAALQVMLAHKHLITNLVIGTSTILIFWILLGGRSFCSWVCPYHFLSELGEVLHLKIFKKRKTLGVTFHRGSRTVIYLLFLLLSFLTGDTLFETISPTGILSRALIYGPGLALVWVALLLLFEIFVSRRAWCRYACPIGLTYGIAGILSPLRVKYTLSHCFHEGDCRKVCLVPHVLEVVVRDRATQPEIAIGPDCTRCGLCIDACPSGALSFENALTSKLSAPQQESSQ